MPAILPATGAPLVIITRAIGVYTPGAAADTSYFLVNTTDRRTINAAGDRLTHG